jgi:hypothetical protein
MFLSVPILRKTLLVAKPLREKTVNTRVKLEQTGNWPKTNGLG